VDLTASLEKILQALTNQITSGDREEVVYPRTKLMGKADVVVEVLIGRFFLLTDINRNLLIFVSRFSS
jgi:hypothetical protein